jgi:hypothetical protein
MFDFLLNKIELREIKYSGLLRILKTPDYLKLGKKQYSIDVSPLLFILIHPSHLKYFLSIVDALEEYEINYSIISLRNDFEDELRPYSNRLIYFSNYYKKIDIHISSFFQFLTYTKYIIFRNRNKAFASLKLYKDYYLMQIALNNILKQNKIKLILMYKGDGFHAQNIGHFIINKKLPIKFIVMQHGLIASIPQFKDLPINEFWVFSKFFQEMLIKLNVKYCLKVVGDPSTDKFFNTKKNLSKKIKREFKVLFVPNHGNNHTPKSQVINTLSWVVRYAIENVKSYVTIKPHPGDVNNIILGNINNSSQINNLKLLSKNDKLLLHNYDIIIVNNSAVGMEAAMNNIPLLILAENRSQIMVKQYLDYGFAEVAFNYDELVNKVTFIRSNYKLFQEKTKAFVRDMYEFRGESTKLILKELSKYN